jgi:hypothetical protein
MILSSFNQTSTLCWTASSKDAETIFGAIFFITWIGFAVVSLNAQLLGA